MRVLYWHVNMLEVKHTQKAWKNANEVKNKELSFRDGVVCFISLEKGDGENHIKMFAEDLERYMNTIKAKRVFVYPYAHLSSNLMPLLQAKEMFEKIITYLKNRKIEVNYAEFGWYKEFKVHVKGHPLAELSRSF